MKKNMFPPGWSEERVNKIIRHYENQSETEAIAEDEAVYENSTYTVMEVPKNLVSKVRELIAKQAIDRCITNVLFKA